jgi:cysteine synthase A
MGMIAADFRRSSDTHMLPIHLPACPGIKLYLKDESSHITGSLKHRLARALYLYALANGYLSQDKLVVERRGSTAISGGLFPPHARNPSWR